MTGELSDRLYIVKDPDTRIAVSIPRTEHTIKFNRQSRFLVSDPDVSTVQAFVLTKPLSVGNIYNGDGYLKFVMSEDNTTDYDNFELMIPDYYRYFPDGDGEYRPTIEETVPKDEKIERGSYI